MDDQLERFEHAWQSPDDPPEIGRFLPTDGSQDRQVVLRELIRIDMDRRWHSQADGLRRAARLKVEDYMRSWPELQPSAELILQEFHIRESLGDAPRVDEYLERFPERHDELQKLLTAVDTAGGGRRAGADSVSEVTVEEHNGPSESESPGAADVLSARSAAANQVIQTIGQYQLLSKLGQGGMGTVYLARHTRLNKEVAIKVLRGRDAATKVQVARFEREMRAIGQLDHPNVVRALDAGEIDGVCFLSMELINGIELSDVITAETRLSVADACEVARQAAIGLQYAHDRGLIHRDVKPSNLMLAVDPVGTVSVKLLDLGLARIINDGVDREQLTDEGQAMGTLQYMAPEQADNTHSVDHRADIYALGVTLYRLLTGTVPFSGSRYSSLAGYLHALTSIDPPGVATLRAELPPDLVALIDSMLLRDPARRPQNLSEVMRLLEPHCVGHRLAELVASINASHHRGTVSRPESALFDGADTYRGTMPGPRNGVTDRGGMGVLLERVRRFWVDGVLTQSVQGTSLLTSTLR